MKKLIKYINQPQTKRILFLILLLSVTAILAHAQSDPGSGYGGGDPDSAPIDGGLSLLIAGGVGYGMKKVRERRKGDKL